MAEGAGLLIQTRGFVTVREHDQTPRQYKGKWHFTEITNFAEKRIVTHFECCNLLHGRVCVLFGSERVKNEHHAALV